MFISNTKLDKCSFRTLRIIYFYLPLLLYLYFFKSTISNFGSQLTPDKWYYRAFYDKSTEEPWKTSWLLRVLLIPATYKNYIIASMNLPFWSYFVPAMVYYIPYWSMYILIGTSIASIDDLMHHRIPKSGALFFLF